VTVTDCWLWREGSGIRWWTSAATGLLAAEHPHPHGVTLDWACQRDGRSQAALQQALPPVLAEVLRASLQESESVRLRLAADLPESWARYPFEWLRHQRNPLQGRVLVERWVPKQPRSSDCLGDGTVAVVDLWPEDEPVRPGDALISHDSTDVYFGPAVALNFFARADLSRLSLLVVLSHGSEANAAAPFVVADGRPFELPLIYGLPPVVLLLACGNEDGNLLDYGRTLLDAGARTVIAPVGRPDARAARDFLGGFLQAWQQGKRVADILAGFHRSAEQERAGWRLCLLGDGSVRAGPPREAADWPDDRLSEAARGDVLGGQAGEALSTLVDRITLDSYQNAGNLESAEARLRAALRIGSGDEREERLLLRALHRYQGRLPPLASAWIIPLLGGLAEAYDHSLLNPCDRAWGSLDSATRHQAPSQSHHYLSRMPYRWGHYVQAARALVDGMVMAGPDNPSRARLLGQLINLLIDLNLPESGTRVDGLLCRCLNAHRGEDAERLRLNRLDRAARLALRRGEPGIAVAQYAEKWRQVRRSRPDTHGLRELITLLYGAAWADPGDPATRTYAREARQFLPGPEAMLATLTPDHPGGNDDAVYLLRALALWTWRAGDREMAGDLSRYGRYLRALVESDRDPGPASFAMWYLTLSKGTGERPGGFPGLDEAEVGLDRENYWLELAALLALSGDRRKAMEYLDRFQSMREEVVSILEEVHPAWQLGDLRHEAARQISREREILAADPQSPLADRLVAAGILPL
jgi:hypothetical protein